MKLWLLLGIILLILPVTYAVRSIDVELKPGESFFLDGKNITLLDSVNKSTMLCINNEIFIVSRDKRVSDVYFDFRKSTYEKASFKVQFDCNHDCQCDGTECDNDVCFFEPEELENIDIGNETFATQEEPEFECENDLDCDDEEICTINVCKNSVCYYEPILGCGSTTQVTDKEDNTIEYLAFSLLGIAILLGIFAIFKSSKKIKKKK
ncbi:hypothetical protein HYT57_05065 [Candidatus Woesearchaeota archaeon]|nr:hypothetical protein [Candidatus Woesearchaeota archaeon]